MQHSIVSLRLCLMGASALAGSALFAPAHAQQAQAPQPKPAAPAAAQAAPVGAASQVEEVVVTGYAKSLEDSSLEKRRRTNFTDSIFAEDIGKFPDLNLAESLQRLPGIQIERDASGEGTRVTIRGLGSQFTVLSMNGAQLQTASDNSIGFVNDGRGSSLDILPTELFRSLTISKTPMASQIEGGIAGNVELRPVRPFDRRGFHVNYQLKGTTQDVYKKISPRGGVFMTNTWDTNWGEFGLLGGFAYANKKYRSDTFNTVGNTTFSLGARCPTTQAGCNSLNFNGVTGNPTYGYGGGASIPNTVPVGTGMGLTAGAPLVPCGPGATPGGTSGLSCNQLSYTLIPRLARAETVVGERKRSAGLLTGQWAPNKDLIFNVDLAYAKTKNDFDQHDLMIMLRSTSNNIPFDVKVDGDNILTHGTFANAQLLSENRPYKTKADFYNVSVGGDWTINDWAKVRGTLTYNTSSQDQIANTVLLRTPLGRGFTVTYDQPDGEITPALSTNFDVNDPNLGWIWDTMRVQPSRRNVTQQDAQLHAVFGDDRFRISTGVQWSQFKRAINGWDVSACATNAANGRCSPTSTIASAYPGALAAVPNAQLGDYMMKWPFGTLYKGSDFNVGLNNGWAVPNYDKIFSAVNVDYFENDLDPTTHVNSYNPRRLNEETTAAYVMVDGGSQFLDKDVRFNAGVRLFHTDQFVSGIVTDPTSGRGVQAFQSKYTDYLPSFNVAVDLTEKLVFRLAGGRTMTRPNPGDLAPQFSLSLGGDTLSLGNPELKPYYANQVDLGLEWYRTRRSTLAINLWKKNIEGFTSIFRYNQRFDQLGINFNNLSQITKDGLTTLGSGNPNAAQVQVSQRQNTSEIIYLTGVELTWLQPLDFITKGLGVNANYTYIHQKSEGAPVATSGTRQAQGSAVTGLSPNTYNLTVYYERGPASARVSYNYRDANVSFLGPQNNIEGDGVNAKSKYLDASIGYAVFKNMRVTFEAQNLLNEIQLTTVDGNPHIPYGAYAPGRTFLVGLSGSF
jgi:TonB-dependent receptor